MALDDHAPADCRPVRQTPKTCRSGFSGFPGRFRARDALTKFSIAFHSLEGIDFALWVWRSDVFAFQPNELALEREREVGLPIGVEPHQVADDFFFCKSSRSRLRKYSASFPLVSMIARKPLWIAERMSLAEALSLVSSVRPMVRFGAKRERSRREDRRAHLRKRSVSGLWKRRRLLLRNRSLRGAPGNRRPYRDPVSDSQPN
jgi:hypothetical protein